MKQKSKDNLIYLGVGLTVAAGFIIYMFLAERTTGRIPDIPGPILWGIISTPGIIAIVLDRFWEQRRSAALWALSIGSASINAAVMVAAYSFRWEAPLIVWLAMTILWVNLILFFGRKLLARRPRR